jgi:hypothetical protein
MALDDYSCDVILARNLVREGDNLEFWSSHLDLGLSGGREVTSNIFSNFGELAEKSRNEVSKRSGQTDIPTRRTCSQCKSPN